MRKSIVLIIYMLCFLSISLCAAKQKLYWYLASSMLKPGKEIVHKFNSEKHDFKVLLVIGGSGHLISKIQLSEKGDLYTPASKYFLNRALESGLVLDYQKLLIQKPVFGLYKSNKNSCSAFSDLLESNIKLAVGNPKTMALGMIYYVAKTKMDKLLVEKLKDNEIVYAISVAQIVNYVLSGVVDAGLMFDTVAKANGLSYIKIPEKYCSGEYAYLATLKCSSNKKNVELFKKFILKQETIFQKYCFQLKAIKN